MASRPSIDFMRISRLDITNHWANRVYVTTSKAVDRGATPLVTRVAIGACGLGLLGNWYTTGKITQRWSISDDQRSKAEIFGSTLRNAYAKSPPPSIHDYYANVNDVSGLRRL